MIFDTEKDADILSRMYGFAEHSVSIKKKDWGIIAFNQYDANCHLISCHENEYAFLNTIDSLKKTYHEKMIYPNTPSGIAGGCLFINRSMFELSNGYRVMGVYAGDDAYLLIDCDKHGFSYQVAETLGVVHPRCNDLEYAEMKYKICQRDSTGETKSDLTEQVEELKKYFKNKK
jgi:hypothetical protein